MKNQNSENHKAQGNREGAAAERNVAAAIFGDLSGTVSRLDQAYRRFDEVSHKGVTRFERSTSPDLERAVSQMYTAAVLIETEGTLQSFLDERGVQVHGNIKNPYASFVQACIGSVHRGLKSALCKRAAVIALARRHDVAPEHFDKWREAWPIERACGEFRRLSNNDGDASDKMDTRGLTGQKVALIEFAANGSGKIKVLKILSEDNSLRSDAPMPSTATPV